MSIARTTTPADMAHFATYLAQLPAAARRAEAVRIVDAVTTHDRLKARGVTPPVSLPPAIISAVIEAGKGMAGKRCRRWGDNPADFMACMALACDVTAGAMAAAKMRDVA
jgi:hypothetical protein